jgi:hypothetical protein
MDLHSIVTLGAAEPTHGDGGSNPSESVRRDRAAHRRCLRPVQELIRLANRRAPHLAALAALIIPRLPGNPLYSATLKTAAPSSNTGPLSIALTCPWISFNTPTYVNAIGIDCDHDDFDRVRYLDQLHIGPNFASVSPQTGRFHATWFLTTPVHRGENARAKPQRLLAWVIALLTAALRGDPAFANALTKNPWGVLGDSMLSRRFDPAPADAPLLWQAHDASGTWLRWHTIEGSLDLFELRDLAAVLEPEFGDAARQSPCTKFRGKCPRGDEAYVGRNEELFHTLRFWGMAHGVLDPALMLAEAEAINRSFASPLAGREVSSTARSVSRWMRDKYHHRRRRTRAPRKREGRMRLASVDLPIKEKQRMAARFAARANRADTDRRLIAAYDDLARAGTTISQTAVAALAGLSERTVRSRWLPLTSGELRNDPTGPAKCSQDPIKAAAAKERQMVEPAEAGD